MTGREGRRAMFELILRGCDELAAGDEDAVCYAALSAHLKAAAEESIRTIQALKAAARAGRN